MFDAIMRTFFHLSDVYLVLYLRYLDFNETPPKPVLKRQKNWGRKEAEKKRPPAQPVSDVRDFTILKFDSYLENLSPILCKHCAQE